MNILFVFPLAYSPVHCQGTELEKRDSLKKGEMYLFAEMFVYNKNKIQMSFVEYGFNFTREVKMCIFHSWLRHS